MSLTKKQIEEYRGKLRDSKYMERAIKGVAEKFLTEPAMEKISFAEPEINNTEEKEMARNSLYDLNDHLFERLERLTDDDVKGEELLEEIKRTDAVVKISSQILNNANLLLKAKIAAANAPDPMKLPAMIEDKKKEVTLSERIKDKTT
jgi:hypothetical protein